MGIEHLAFRVIVRRATNGPVPFQWEVERDNAIAPVQVSTNRFRGMEDAYEAGKAWLNDFLSSRSSISNRQSIRLDVTELNDLDELDEEHISELEYEAE